VRHVPKLKYEHDDAALDIMHHMLLYFVEIKRGDWVYIVRAAIDTMSLPILINSYKPIQTYG